MTEYRLLLRELRQAHQLSQEALARELGISRQSIISLEQGEYFPSFPILISLIDFFECPIDQLIDGENIKHKLVGSQIYENITNLVGAANLSNSKTGYEVKMLLPGYKESQLQINLEENQLVISGEIEEDTDTPLAREWQIGSFSKTIPLPEAVDPTTAKAKLTDGILSIKIDTAPTEKPKSITIKIN